MTKYLLSAEPLILGWIFRHFRRLLTHLDTKIRRFTRAPRRWAEWRGKEVFSWRIRMWQWWGMFGVEFKNTSDILEHCLTFHHLNPIESPLFRLEQVVDTLRLSNDISDEDDESPEQLGVGQEQFFDNKISKCIFDTRRTHKVMNFWRDKPFPFLPRTRIYLWKRTSLFTIF